jgi:hypothetical protein
MSYEIAGKDRRFKGTPTEVSNLRPLTLPFANSNLFQKQQRIFSFEQSELYTACELGFRGSLDEWERLMGAVARR